MSPPAVACRRLVHVYGAAGEELTALHDVDLEVPAGETVAILGPSGSGKSTLLWILAGLTRPTAGAVDLFGRPLAAADPDETARLRRREIGVVLQNPGRNLLPYETAAGNVAFAQRAGRRREDDGPKVGELLEAVGLGSIGRRRAGSLSGGEQQRLAVAVALANRPRLILADEPTSQLDSRSAAAVLHLLQEANRQQGTTVVTVSHDPLVRDAMHRTITIRDGRVGVEGRSGEEYLVVGRDGTVQLPESLLDVLAPGSRATAHRTAEGVELRPVADPEQP